MTSLPHLHITLDRLQGVFARSPLETWTTRESSVLVSRLINEFTYGDSLPISFDEFHDSEVCINDSIELVTQDGKPQLRNHEQAISFVGNTWTSTIEQNDNELVVDTVMDTTVSEILRGRFRQAFPPNMLEIIQQEMTHIGETRRQPITSTEKSTARVDMRNKVRYQGEKLSRGIVIWINGQKFSIMIGNDAIIHHIVTPTGIITTRGTIVDGVVTNRSKLLDAGGEQIVRFTSEE